MKKDKLLVCSFSGGRTSAFMAQFLNTFPKYDDYDKAFIFANTGKEREETLEFIDRCDKEWGLGIVWLEAKVTKEKGIGVSYNIVDFKSASRKGEPFEEVIKKYTLPNVFGSTCTERLKMTPIKKYIQSLKYKNWVNAIGIRYDERHRKSINAEKNKTIYPLCDDIKVDSKFIRTWWDSQCFDLQLKDYEGNCDLCFKKSVRKRLTIIKENPSSAEWWAEMEKKYGGEKKLKFDLRSKKSIEDLIKMSKEPFRTIADKHETEKKQISLFDVDMDVETDCFCKAT